MAEDKKTEEVKVVEQKAAETEKAQEIVELQPDQLQLLKQKADLLSVGYSTNVTVDELKAKITAFQEGTKTEPQKEVLSAREEAHQTKTRIRQELQKEALLLKRVRITCMNPAKADLSGEVLTVSNNYIGEVKRFIPYGEQIDGWHVEAILLDMMKEKQFQQIRTKKGANGQILPETKWVREYAIEELPPLTEKELKILANKQAAAAGLVSI